MQFHLKEIPLLDELPQPNEDFWWSLFLWDQDHSPHPSMDNVKQQGYFVANSDESEE